MSQREALLAGARRCLAEKGYSNTTARDIVAASGAHLASIGYHFGSKDRLMIAAVMAASSEWGDTVEAAARTAGGATPIERLTTLITQLLTPLRDARELQSASLQALAHSTFDDELRTEMAHGLASARTALAGVVLGDAGVGDDPELDSATGSLVGALVTGLIAQSVVDPDSLPDAAAVRNALAAISATGSLAADRDA